MPGKIIAGMSRHPSFGVQHIGWNDRESRIDANRLGTRRGKGAVGREERERRPHRVNGRRGHRCRPPDGPAAIPFKRETRGRNRTVMPVHATLTAGAPAGRVTRPNLYCLVPDIAKVNRHHEGGVGGPVALVGVPERSLGDGLGINRLGSGRRHRGPRAGRHARCQKGQRREADHARYGSRQPPHVQGHIISAVSSSTNTPRPRPRLRCPPPRPPRLLRMGAHRFSSRCRRSCSCSAVISSSISPIMIRSSE